MKKLLAIIAVILMFTMCMTVTAFAEEEGPDVGVDGGDASADVLGNYEPGSVAATVISVNITWGSMEFTYNDTVEGTWNDKTHDFDNDSPANWTYDEGANEITVVNHSNTAITAEFSFEAADGIEVEGSFTDLEENQVEINTAVGTSPTEAPCAVTLFTVSGKMASSTEKVTLGSITIQINKVA